MQLWDFIAKYWIEFGFGAVLTILGALYRKMSKQIREDREKQKAIEDGMRALLRNEIITAYNQYVVDKKYCPVYGKENVNAMYDAYHRLGGNGTITQLKQQIDDLPTVKPG